MHSINWILQVSPGNIRIIESICNCITLRSRSHVNTPINFKHIFEISVMNTLWLIIAGESHDYNDPVALRWHRLAYE